MRRGREGAVIAYSIVVTVLLILRASAILSAPVGPISLPANLIQRERERERDEKRRGLACLTYISDGVVDLESLGDLLGSDITNITPTQPNSERERERERQMRRGREGAAIANCIVVMVLLILRASAIFSAPVGPISLQPKLIQRERERERERDREMRRGREGAAIAYPIQVTVLLILRASAILSAPVGPILLPYNLIQRERDRERDEKRRGLACLPYKSDGVVDLESLGDLLGSSWTNIISTQPNSEIR
jgi:hypothetical protein